MNEALDAVKEIQSALSEHGSDITYRKIEQETYNPMTGETTQTITDTNTKAFIKKQATEATQRAYGEDYEVSFIFHLQEPPDKKGKVIFRGETYNIVYIAPSTLQNTDFKYEILGKR